MKLKVATVQMTTDDRNKTRVVDQIDEVKHRYPLMLQRRPDLYGLIGRDK